MSGATTSPKKAQAGVSLWTDAWRRLKKNSMAMIGLWIVVVMGVLCGLAPVISPFDASFQFTWINALPPGGSHVNVNNKNALRVDVPVDLRREYADAQTLRFEVEEKNEVGYRVVVRRGKVHQIRMTQGAKRVARLSPEAKGEYLVIVDPDGTRSAALVDAVVEEKQPLPEVFGKAEVLNLLLVQPSGGKQIIEATVTKGVVSKLIRDGQAIARADFDGRDVLSVVADGEPQTVTHILGTDQQGRDLLSRTLYGGMISLLVGLVATIVSLVIGIIYGAISGYFGGKVDLILMAIVDVLYGIPYLFLVILLMVTFGRDIIMLFVALGAVQWLTMARIVRGQILSLKQKEFVEAARMSGTTHLGILFNHLIPNTLGIVIVYTTLTVPAVILQESFLAFIGLSVEYQGKSQSSWGALVNEGMLALGEDGQRAWLLLVPSLAMAATLFSLNFLGDGLRDALDPQQRGRT